MRENSNKKWVGLGFTSVTLILAAALCVAQETERIPAPESLPLLFRLDSAKWSEPYNGPLGYPKGAQRASLGVDPRTGGETYYAHFPAGSRFELHWHAHREYAVVLRGRVTHTLGSDIQVLLPGDYVIIPAKVNHGWDVDTSGDAYLMIRREGPADFNFVGK